ncbi:MAG: hypothetical protein K9J77_06175, partial [Rhodoferax sp.]|nr:hypothetical protein [Rhodoferax sp.]
QIKTKYCIYMPTIAQENRQNHAFFNEINELLIFPSGISVWFTEICSRAHATTCIRLRTPC